MEIFWTYQKNHAIENHTMENHVRRGLTVLSKKHDHDALISISISSTNRFVLLTKYTYVLLIYYLLHRYTIDRFNYFK